MKQKSIAPVIVGRGMAGQAILKSLAVVAQADPELHLLPAKFVSRGSPLRSYISDNAQNVLFVANPSGLHARYIAEGERAQFDAIVSDKPVCVLPEEIEILEKIRVPVTVFHGYRAMWGTKKIKQMIEAGDLGDLLAFEARYWQSSSALAALANAPEKRPWKNDPKLNGPSDTLIDLGSHVVDICLYLMADRPAEGRCWLSYRNSLAPHRDTHVHLWLCFENERSALASISKTVHGATNNFEYTIIGTRATATWRFLRPDEIEHGIGNRTFTIRRSEANASSGSSPFHGLGWLEGYVEITRQTLRQVAGLASLPVPTLKESVAVMDVLLKTRFTEERRPHF
jgi:predicted dehydrogenase